MELIKEKWRKKDYNEFINYLYSFKDEEYKKFSINIIKDNTLIGIRTPILKNIAKMISKGNYKDFLSLTSDNTYEEKLIYGLILGNLNEINFKYIDVYKHKINNWALCDSFVMNMKIIKKNKKLVLEYILNNISSNNSWIRRMCFVTLLDYYISSENIKLIFDLCDTYNTNDYYVQMSVAWLLSMCYIKYKEETKKYLDSNKLNNFTYNKTIQKIIESNVVSKEEKDLLRSKKRGKNENSNS